jgi:hypothetical protein
LNSDIGYLHFRQFLLEEIVYELGTKSQIEEVNSKYVPESKKLEDKYPHFDKDESMDADETPFSDTQQEDIMEADEEVKEIKQRNDKPKKIR